MYYYSFNINCHKSDKHQPNSQNTGSLKDYGLGFFPRENLDKRFLRSLYFAPNGDQYFIFFKYRSPLYLLLLKDVIDQYKYFK